VRDELRAHVVAERVDPPSTKAGAVHYRDDGARDEDVSIRLHGLSGIGREDRIHDVRISYCGLHVGRHASVAQHGAGSKMRSTLESRSHSTSASGGISRAATWRDWCTVMRLLRHVTEPTGNAAPGLHTTIEAVRSRLMRPALLLTGVAALVAGCSSEPKGLPPDTIDYSQPVTITYEAEGSATSVDLVVTAGEERVELNDKAVPITEGPSGDPVTVEVPILERVGIAVTIGPDGGDITCRLLADGEVLDEGFASGAYATARCEGRAPAPTVTPSTAQG
jgi:hypothetical protein